MKKLGINSVINIVGTGSNAVLGLIFYLLTARVLGPLSFGILSVVLAVSVISSDFFDFGLNTSLVKHIPALPKERKDEFLKNFLGLRLIVSFSLMMLALLISYLLSVVLFKSGSNWSLIFLGFGASAATGLFGFYNSVLIADKKFISSSALNLSSNLLRLALLLLILAVSKLSIASVLYLYILSLLIIPVAFIVLFKDLQITPAISKKTVREISHFGKWVGGSLILGSISARLDNLFLVRLTSPLETGLYSSVQRIFLAFNQLIGASSSVVAPEMSSADDAKVHNSFRFGFYLAGLFAAGLLVITIVAPVIVPLLLGQAYLSSVLVFQILTVGTIFFVLNFPVYSYLLYTHGRSKNLFGFDMVRLVMVIILDLVLIPRFGANGAATAYSLTLFISFALTTRLYFSQRHSWAY